MVEFCVGHEALVYAVFHRIRFNKFNNNVALPFILRIHDMSLERKHCSEFSETLKEINVHVGRRFVNPNRCAGKR